MKKVLYSSWLLLALCVSLFAQSNVGDLRVHVTGPTGLGIGSSIQLVSDVNQFRQTLVTDDTGNLVVRRLPFGVYRLEIRQPGFADVSELVEIRSSTPTYHAVQLRLPSVTESVTVSAVGTLINPDQAGSVNQIGSGTIQDRQSSLPGRSLQDLVNSQPGWLYEGNAVLHPRGSEYQTQFVVDGIPLTDNRSPSFGPEIEADDVESINIYTAGIPAEYGRKMGGVVELNTLRNSKPGFHAEAVLSGGSFDTAGAFARAQYTWGRNTVGGSASGNMTGRYLNPVVPENYTNRGTTGDFSFGFERDVTPKDHLTLSVRHELSRYEIPNEQVQEYPQLRVELGQPAPPAGTLSQLQTADNFETMGMASYEHIFSSNALLDIRAMARDNANNFYSNPYSWPIIVTQHNDFRERYFKAATSVHHGHQEWKVGIESDNFFLRENYSDVITASQIPNSTTGMCFPFDCGTAPMFSFFAYRPDLEQAAFIQDLVHLGNWTVNAGARWDHYQLLLNQNAVSARAAVSHYFSSAALVVHTSYDGAFQTPSFENILLSSSSQVQSFEPFVLRLPVKPSHGNYLEVGASKSFLNQFRLDANYFRRYVNNYADDNQLLNKPISFPIAFRKAILYGAEAKIEVPHWNRFSGLLAYSYIVGNCWFPVTGGLFLGQENFPPITGHIPDSQDQRNTARIHVRYQVAQRVWLATGTEYGSGLPFAFNGSYQQALAEYGQAIVNRVNISSGRIRPNLAVNASVGADLHKSEKLALRLQVDAENLNNRLNVIDFGGLFSGNAIGPSRSYAVRLTASF